MQTKNKRIIYLSTPDEINDRHYRRRLWVAIRNVKISRRSWPEEISDTFRDFGGIVLYRGNIPYKMPDIDEVFGRDPSMRWLSYVLTPTASNEPPFMRTRKIQRLQILDLYFRIKHPQIARNFGQ